MASDLERKADALNELRSIQAELADKVNEIELILAETFPNELPHAEAYWLGSLLHASQGDPNPYNSSLDSFIEEQEDEAASEEQEIEAEGGAA